MQAESDLSLVRENSAFNAGEVLGALQGPARVEVRALAIEMLCSLHRRLGICALLLDADASAFLRSLSTSGRATASLLSRVRWPDVIDFSFLCASKTFGFFDALAAGDEALAAEIAVRCAPSFVEGDEDEDDFAFTKAVMALHGDGSEPASDAPGRVAHLARTAVRGDPRPALCRALLAGKGKDDALEEALFLLVARRLEEVAAERESPHGDPEWLATEGFLYVEGVALCRLARQRGISIRRRYPLIPDPAYLRSLDSFPPRESWQVAPKG